MTGCQTLQMPLFWLAQHLPFRNRDSAYTGRAGLTYLFSNGIAPYVSYSQSFLPQAGIADGTAV